MPPPETPRLPRVLLIDDDPVTREVLAMMLETYGFPVDSAEDGQTAIQFLNNSHEPPGLVLMDTQMPGLSGIDLVEALREACNARIVAISGSEIDDHMRQAADGFLLKPVEAEAVMALCGTVPAHKNSTVSLMAAASSADVINADTLGKLKAMMPASAVREVYAAVAGDLANRLDVLESAMQAGNAAKVSSIAHTIKGGCAMAGVSMARDAAAELEKSNGHETWPKQLSRLRFAMGELQRMLGDGSLP